MFAGGPAIGPHKSTTRWVGSSELSLAGVCGMKLEVEQAPCQTRRNAATGPPLHAKRPERIEYLTIWCIRFAWVAKLESRPSWNLSISEIATCIDRCAEPPTGRYFRNRGGEVCLAAGPKTSEVFETSEVWDAPPASTAIIGAYESGFGEARTPPPRGRHPGGGAVAIRPARRTPPRAARDRLRHFSYLGREGVPARHFRRKNLEKRGPPLPAHRCSC